MSEWVDEFINEGGQSLQSGWTRLLMESVGW